MIVSRLFGVLVASITVISSLAVSPSASATTFAGDNGKIALTKIHAGTSTIWTLQANETQLLPLTRGSSHSPTWSPDGRKIVFVHSVNGQSRLHVMEADGSKRRVLTNGIPGRESTPTWTKDGQRIAFVGERIASGQTQTAIFTVHHDGSQLQNETGWGNSPRFRSPSWSPDGRALVYEQYGGTKHLLIIKNLVTNTSRIVTTLSDPDHQAQPAWSPNGKKILFSDSANEVYTIWADGSHRSVISDGDSYAASWSPTGETIAFIEDAMGDTITISQKDGSLSWIDISKEGYGRISPPVWSPDGKQLLFSMQRIDQSISDAFIVEIATQKLTKRASGQFGSFAWQSVRK